MAKPRLIKRQGDNKNDMNVKNILEFLHLPDACMKDNLSSKSIYATTACNFPPVDVRNIEGLTIVHDLNLVTEEIKSLKQKSSAAQQLSDQPAEIRCRVSKFSAFTRKNALKESLHSFLPFQDSKSMISNKPTYAEKLLRKTTGPSFLEIVHELSEVELRTQPSRPRPNNGKKFEAKDRVFEDRPSRGKGQDWSKPRPRLRAKNLIFLNYGRQIFQYF